MKSGIGPFGDEGEDGLLGKFIVEYYDSKGRWGNGFSLWGFEMGLKGGGDDEIEGADEVFDISLK